MNNVAMQEFIDQFGKGIFSIKFDNDRHLLVGYKDTPKLDDIALETIGGVDFIKIRNHNTNNGKTIWFNTYHITSNVQSVGVMEPGYEEYGVDPFAIR